MMHERPTIVSHWGSCRGSGLRKRLLSCDYRIPGQFLLLKHLFAFMILFSVMQRKKRNWGGTLKGKSKEALSPIKSGLAWLGSIFMYFTWDGTPIFHILFTVIY